MGIDIQNGANATAAVSTDTTGYFRFTMNRLEPSSPKLWFAYAFGTFFFLYVLRRIWIEWETFISLRFDFLANGDVEKEICDSSNLTMSPGSIRSRPYIPSKDNVQLHLEQYRNSCIVEYIPESHRRDKELFEFFDAVFPNQVKRAEILLNATLIAKLIHERQRYIEKYEALYAQRFHARKMYRHLLEAYKTENESDSFFRNSSIRRAPRKPEDPTIVIHQERSFFCLLGRSSESKKVVKALPYCLSEIKRLNREIEIEYRRILCEKQKVKHKDAQVDIIKSNLAGAVKFMIGVGEDLTVSTFLVTLRVSTAIVTLRCDHN